MRAVIVNKKWLYLYITLAIININKNNIDFVMYKYFKWYYGVLN